MVVTLLAVPLFGGCLGDVLAGPVRPDDYLEDDKYTTWVIEIDYVQGYRPSDSALSMLRSRLAEVVNKDSIEIRVDDVIDGRDRWSSSQIQGLERSHKDAQTGGSQVVTWVVYLDGQFDDGGVAGVTIGYDIIGMFAEAIDNACGPLSLCFGAEQSIEGAVLVHEFGHAIGLVNRGVDMVEPHEDPEHPGHSDNRNSVMWWQVESTAALGSLNTIPNRFDGDDKADLCAAGGRC